MFLLSARNSSDAPKWDDFPIVGEPLVKSLEGSLTLSDLYRQEVDNRMLFPKLVHVAMARVSQWRIHYETGMTVFLGALSVVLLCLMVRKTFPQASFRSWLMALLCGGFVFSMTGWMIWIYGTFLVYSLVFLFLTGQLLIFQTSISLYWKITLAAALAFMAANSFLNGWLNWGVLFWMVLGMRMEGKISNRDFRNAIVLCMVFLALTAWPFFSGYKLQSQPGLAARVLADPMKYITFFLRWLGSPFGHPWPDLAKPERLAWQDKFALWMGSLVLVLLLAASILAWKSPAKRAAVWLWCALGLWGLASGCLVTLGRADLSAEAYFWPRYQLFTAAVYLSLIAVLFICCGRIRTPLMLVLILPMTILALGWRNGAITGYRAMRADYFGSQMVHGALIMMKVAPEPLFLNGLLPGNFQGMQTMVNKLEDRKFIRPGILTSEKVADAPVSQSSNFIGKLVEGSRTSNSVVELKGWAIDLEHRCPADCIVISVQPEGGEEIWWAVCQTRKPSAKIAEQRNLSRANSRIGWELDPPADLPVPPRKPLPAGNFTLRAYVLDVDHLIFHPLRGSFIGSVRDA